MFSCLFQIYLIFSAQTLELTNHHIDLPDIALGQVIAATFSRRQPKSVMGEVSRHAGATQMDQGGEILLLSRRRFLIGLMPENRGDGAIQMRRGQFDRVARQNAGVEIGKSA